MEFTLPQLLSFVSLFPPGQNLIEMRFFSCKMDSQGRQLWAVLAEAGSRLQPSVVCLAVMLI